MARRTGASLRVKLAVLLVVFALAPMAAAMYFSLEEQEAVFRESTIDSLEALVKTKAEAINQFSDFRKRDVERIATLLAPSLTELEAALDEKGAEPEPPPETLPDLKDAEELPKPHDDEPLPEPTPKEKIGTPKTTPDVPPVRGEADTGSAGVADGTGVAPAEGAESNDDAAKQGSRGEGNVEEAGAGEGAKPSDPVEDARARLRRTLGLMAWDQEEFEEFLVIDAKGRVIASTFEKHEGHAADQLDYFKSGIKATYLQPVFLSPITEQLTMVIATPIRNDAHESIGVLAARLNLKRFFRLLNDSTGLGEEGEIVAGQVADGEVVFMAPTRHDPVAALQRKVPLGSDMAKPIQKAASGETGSGLTTDYRGVEVFAAWQHVPSLDWGIVVKIDYREAMRAVLESRRGTLAGAAIITVCALGAAFFVSQLFVRPLRELRHATERLSRGDFEVSLDIRSGDEIGELADSFDRMVAAIKFFREQSRGDEEALDSEPDAAAGDDTSVAEPPVTEQAPPKPPKSE